MKQFSFVVLLCVHVVIGLDVDSLMELKKGIQIDPSGKLLVSWDSKSISSNGCPRDWFGVSCAGGRVTSITVSGLGLVGEFNFSVVSSLRMLQNLSIANNELSGSITEGISLLDSLQSLDISWNSFGGLIPTGFARLKLLKYMDLSNNGFIGDVMGILGQLGAVKYVDLSGNFFSGSLDLGEGKPDFISSIRHLNISRNNLTGELFPHDGIPYFDSLEVFDASDNHIVGNVPSFSFVVSLRVLKLRGNQLAGSLPEGLLKESSMILSELDLSHNQLEGAIESISSTNLRMLNLSFNRLSGPLPLRINHCAIIDLSNNMFAGNLSRFQSWGNYVELIDLSSNQLTGSFVNQSSQFLRLTSLNLSSNSLDGVLPPNIGTYPELEVIDLSHNRLAGFLLPSLFNSSKLININLSWNNFSGAIPSDAVIQQNYSLLSLDLSHNLLSGPLPPELGRFGSMSYLDLSSNLLQGGIPDDLPATMLGFNVSSNNLSGVVPESLQRFPSSSFRPGNFFLVLPNLTPTKGGSELNLRSHGSRTKSVIRAAIIAGIIVTFIIIAILIVVLHFRLQRERHKKASAKDGPKKVLSPVRAETSSLPVLVSPAVRKPESSSPPALVSAAVRKPESSSPPVASPDVRNPGSINLPVLVSPTGKKTEASDFQEPARKSDVVSSPASPANVSSKKPQQQSENLNALKVCSPDKLAGDLHLFDNSLKFTPEDLSSAPADAVGMSCHGTMYKAVLNSGYVLAVKLLKQGIAKGRKDFAREAKKLGNIRHPNLVSLQGFYWGPKEHEKLIISNYIDAPCLTLYLRGTTARPLPPLSLISRLKIALDVAQCLTYLHNESAIPHGNLKSTNILIEIPTMNALLTDYSLHRLLTSTGIGMQVLDAGTLGYLPPEFTSTSKPCPSLKSDVYAFGVILLELLTGRSSADIVPGNSQVVHLSEWVKSMAAENRAIECCDLRILSQSGETVSKCLDAMLQIALKCILPADERPDMRAVFEDLSSVVL